MEAIMRILSFHNPVFAHHTFRKNTDHNLQELHSAITATITLIGRWLIAGIWIFIIAMPAVISFISSN
jgi:hypothetical protein